MTDIEAFLESLPLSGVPVECVPIYRHALRIAERALATDGKDDLVELDLPLVLDAAHAAGALPRQIKNLEIACRAYVAWQRARAATPSSSEPRSTRPLTMEPQAARSLPEAMPAPAPPAARAPEPEHDEPQAAPSIHLPPDELVLSPWPGAIPSPPPVGGEPRPPAPSEPPQPVAQAPASVPSAPAPSAPPARGPGRPVSLLDELDLPLPSRSPIAAPLPGAPSLPGAPPARAVPRGTAARPPGPPLVAIAAIALGIVLALSLVVFATRGARGPAPAANSPAAPASSGAPRPFETTCQRLERCCNEGGASMFCGVAQTGNLSACANALSSTKELEGVDCRLDRDK